MRAVQTTRGAAKHLSRQRFHRVDILRREQAAETDKGREALALVVEAGDAGGERQDRDQMREIGESSSVRRY
jgi:hypothetical protein